jgi:hypothetical protein
VGFADTRSCFGCLLLRTKPWDGLLCGRIKLYGRIGSSGVFIGSQSALRHCKIYLRSFYGMSSGMCDQDITLFIATSRCPKCRSSALKCLITCSVSSSSHSFRRPPLVHHPPVHDLHLEYSVDNLHPSNPFPSSSSH